MKRILAIAGAIALVHGTASAQVSRGWFEYGFGKLGLEGSKALGVVVEEGLVLSRVRKDYAAFTTGTQRLSEANRKSDPVNVSEFGMVLEFETCNATNELLSGRISKVRFRWKATDADKLVDEILDINEYFFRVTRENWKVKQATKTLFVGTQSVARTLGDRQLPVAVEFRLSKDTHHIVLTGDAPGACDQ